MIINQDTSLLHQESSQRNDLFTNHRAIREKLACAWCLAEQGIRPDEGSHGICKRHSDQLLEQWREHKAHCHIGIH